MMTSQAKLFVTTVSRQPDVQKYVEFIGWIRRFFNKKFDKGVHKTSSLRLIRTIFRFRSKQSIASK